MKQSNIQDKIETMEKKLTELKEELKEELKQETNKTEWIDIGNGKQISITQLYNGKTYAEIKGLLKENEEIADYPLLQKLRNSGKFEFMKEFWVFVPNPDLISEKNGYVAWFGAGSDWAGFNCNGDADFSGPSLGCFLIRRSNGKSKN